jgi:uncharacterized protein (TIGR02266 family)
MARVFLEVGDTAVEMPAGEHLIGRDLDCRLRFNDGAISRHHLRVVVTGERVTIEDLKTTNGSTLNGAPLVGLQSLKDGDEIRLGDRALKVLFVTEIDLPPVREVAAARAKTTPPTTVPEKRHSTRIPIDVSVVYKSARVEFESTAVDISRGGLFLETDESDAVGTVCSLTLLPKGGPAVQVQAVVSRVEPRGGGRPGIGVQFGSMSPEANAWVVALLREARRA